MTWTKVSDDYFGRPDVLALPRSAVLLDLEGTVYCNRHLLDGRLPKGLVGRITSSDDVEGDVAALVRAGRWTDDGDCWQLDWSDQRPGADVKAEQEKAKARMQRNRKHNNGDHSLCDPKGCWVLLGRAKQDKPVRANVRPNSRRTSAEVRPSSPVPDPTPREGQEKEARAAQSDSALARSSDAQPKSPPGPPPLPKPPLPPTPASLTRSVGSAATVYRAAPASTEPVDKVQAMWDGIERRLRPVATIARDRAGLRVIVGGKPTDATASHIERVLTSALGVEVVGQ